jgi:hypothetical protein
MIRLALITSMLWSASALADAKYFVVVRGVTEAEGVTSGIVPEAKQLFIDEIKRHPELTLDAPEGLPSEPAAMSAELKKRKLRAFEMTLKILKVDRALKPPPPGKQYQVLERGIKLSVFGDTLPENVVAIGGDGDSIINAELGKQQDVEAEGKKLLIEATKEACKQAVDMTVTKLNLAGKPEKKKPKKK